MYEFRKYCIVGGMPEAIKMYAQTRDLLSLDTVYDGFYVLPVEVKTGTNAHLRSLHIFMSDAPHDLAIRVWSGRMSVDEVKESGTGKVFRLLNIPYYYVGVLDKILDGMS